MDVKPAVKPLPKTGLSDDMQGNSWSPVIVVVPLAGDGGTQHAFAVVRKMDNPPMVIDSNEDKFMMLSKESLDRCCGPLGYSRVKFALQIKMRVKK